MKKKIVRILTIIWLFIHLELKIRNDTHSDLLGFVQQVKSGLEAITWPSNHLKYMVFWINNISREKEKNVLNESQIIDDSQKFSDLFQNKNNFKDMITNKKYFNLDWLVK